MPPGKEDLIKLVADIVSAHLRNNRVATGDVAGLIETVFEALDKLGALLPEPVPEKRTGAISARASIKPDHLISMIDGKPYRTLRRHLGRHGYTPESYHEMFDLRGDYPMTAQSYSQARRTLARQLGLRRKKSASVAEPEPVIDAGSSKPPRRKLGLRHATGPDVDRAPA